MKNKRFAPLCARSLWLCASAVNVRNFITFVLALAIIVLAFLTPARAAAVDRSPEAAIIKDVGIDQHMGAQIPLDITLRDETGHPVTIADLQKEANGKPVILSLVYFQCPMLCTLVLNDLLSTTKVIPQTIGQEYQVWTVSFDPKETAALALKKKTGYVNSYNRTKGHGIDASAGWRFLTGDEENISRLTSAVGFRYRWDVPTAQYIHPAGIMILTPEAKIARYFFGINFDPTDIRLSLVEASHGAIATPTDKILLFCYHYDPATGKYGLAIANTLRATGVLTILALGTMGWFLFRYDRARTRRLLQVAETHAPALDDVEGDPR